MAIRFAFMSNLGSKTSTRRNNHFHFTIVTSFRWPPPRDTISRFSRGLTDRGGVFEIGVSTRDMTAGGIGVPTRGFAAGCSDTSTQGSIDRGGVTIRGGVSTRGSIGRDDVTIRGGVST